MNAPKNRQSDDRKSHIASLVLLTPVAVSWPCASWPGSTTSVRRAGRRPDPSSSAPSWGSMPHAYIPNRTTSAPIGTSHSVLEHRRVPEDRQAESEDEREVRRRRHVDAVPVAVPFATVLVAPVTAGGTFLDRDRGTARNAHRVAALVLGVLAVPEVVRAPRPAGSRRSCTWAAATGSSTRASGRPTGRRPPPARACGSRSRSR